MDNKVFITIIKGMISPYIKRDFHRSRARRVLHLALDQTHGGPVEGLHRIPSFLAVLEAEGRTTGLLYQNASIWYCDPVKFANERYKKEQRKLPVDERVPFDPIILYP